MANYESEAKLEDRMIDQLRRQGYNYIEINDVKELEQNFRNQVNLHNKVELKGKDLSDKEFEKLMIKIFSFAAKLKIYSARFAICFIGFN